MRSQQQGASGMMSSTHTCMLGFARKKSPDVVAGKSRDDPREGADLSLHLGGDSVSQDKQ